MDASVLPSKGRTNGGGTLDGFPDSLFRIPRHRFADSGPPKAKGFHSFVEPPVIRSLTLPGKQEQGCLLLLCFLRLFVAIRYGFLANAPVVHELPSRRP